MVDIWYEEKSGQYIDVAINDLTVRIIDYYRRRLGFEYVDERVTSGVLGKPGINLEIDRGP